MNWNVIEGDCLAGMATLADGSVQCCVTSPPYWGLRDYGTAEWEGGDPECDHLGKPMRTKASINANCGTGSDRKNADGREPMGAACSKCGARRIDRQLGLEPTPAEYVAKMVAVFREVRRVLADDGTLWLNLGDSYAGVTTGLKPKDLVGIPWRVAFALQADGWWLRQDIVWAKPNPMPESVTDRCTKAHEYVFLLTKSERYWYDADAIREPHESKPVARNRWQNGGGSADSLSGNTMNDFGAMEYNPLGRNKRSVWTVTTEPFPGAHFAVMPTALVKPCVLAGARAAGKRCDCDQIIATPTGDGTMDDPTLITGRAGMNRKRGANEGVRPITRREQRSHAEQLRRSNHRAQMEQEAGSAFEHYIRTDYSGARPLPQRLVNEWTRRGWLLEAPPCSHPIMPADTVLDPFTGSGTVGVVAVENGCSFVGTELNPEYAEMARRRIGSAASQGILFGAEDR